MPRQSPVSQPRPRPQGHTHTPTARIVCEHFVVRFKDEHGKRVFKDMKLQSISHKRALKMGHDALRTLSDNGIDTTGITVNVIGAVVR